MIKITNNTDILAIAIKQSKVYSQEYKISALEAYNMVIHNYFFYSEAHFNNICTMNEYFEFFYNLAQNKENLPVLYEQIIVMYYGGHIETVQMDYEFLEKLCSSIEGEQKRTAQIMTNTKQLRKILSKQCVPFDKIETIQRIVQINNSPDIFFYSNLYNYGFIEGKRAERARRKRAV